MPPRKQAKRKTTANAGRSDGIHPLGKLFFVLLIIGAIGILLIGLFRDKSEEAIEPAQPIGRPVANSIEAQIALAREGFSPGSIDGQTGSQTQLAFIAYQTAKQLPQSGILDLATTERLLIEDPVFARVELTANDFKKIGPKPSSWIERGQVDQMRYNSILEMIAEKTQCDPDFIVQLNPNINWSQLVPGDQILAPHLRIYQIAKPFAYVRIQLSKRILQAFDENGQIRFHCPVSIARRIDKRPSGELAVKVLVKSPNYTFNPAILTATAEREGITNKFIIQPGPNNPVGSVWIGLNLPSYGIHGTPEPEKVGRTESSGCFRLANWNAQALLNAAWVGMPIIVDP